MRTVQLNNMSLDRDDAIKRIRIALKKRSGKSWSVTGGRGTAWGWIKIKSPPSRAKDEFGTMTDEECVELGKLLGKDRVHFQGESIPASSRQEYVDRAEGREPSVIAESYWD